MCEIWRATKILLKPSKRDQLKNLKEEWNPGVPSKEGKPQKRKTRPDRINIAARMFLGGASIREIGRRMMLNQQTICNYLTEVGIKQDSIKMAMIEQIKSEKGKFGRPKTKKPEEIVQNLPTEESQAHEEEPLGLFKGLFEQIVPSSEDIAGGPMEDKDMMILQTRLETQAEKLGRSLDNLEHRIEDKLREIRKQVEDQSLGSGEAGKRIQDLVGQVETLRESIPRIPPSMCEEYPALCKTVGTISERLDTLSGSMPSNLCQIWPDLCGIAEREKEAKVRERKHEGHVPASGHKTVKELMECPECHAKEWVQKNLEKVFSDEEGDGAISEYLRSRGFTVMKQIEGSRETTKKKSMI